MSAVNWISWGNVAIWNDQIQLPEHLLALLECDRLICCCSGLSTTVPEIVFDWMLNLYDFFFMLVSCVIGFRIFLLQLLYFVLDAVFWQRGRFAYGGGRRGSAARTKHLWTGIFQPHQTLWILIALGRQHWIVHGHLYHPAGLVVIIVTTTVWSSVTTLGGLPGRI